MLNVVFLVIGFSCVWYLHSLPFSIETQQKIEAFAPSNLALTVLLVWGSAMRLFYWYKENRSADNPTYWRDNYWKQLAAWLAGIVFTEFWAMIFLVL